jgi:thiamine-phosphate pyrophosphorylase
MDAGDVGDVVIISRLYAIVDAETLARKQIAAGEFARELRDAGVRLVQYRDKGNGPKEVLRAAEEIAEAFAGVDAALVMNDRADLAALMGWGVHVGQGDLAVEDVLRVLGFVRPHPSQEREGWATRASLVGVSTHDEEQVLRAAQDDKLGGADYVAVGPVFATSTKVDAEAVVGLEGVRRARGLTTMPLVAIGGITLENCRSVVEAGADSVAVIGGLFVEGRSVGDVARDFLERLR